jgi:hypothetical protein
VGTDDGSAVLATRLVHLLEGSRPLPLLRSQVRVKKTEVYELVAAMRSALVREERGVERVPRVPNSLLDAAEAVEDAVYRAPPVPLTDDVRLPDERIHELARALRAAGA